MKTFLAIIGIITIAAVVNVVVVFVGTGVNPVVYWYGFFADLYQGFLNLLQQHAGLR